MANEHVTVWCRPVNAAAACETLVVPTVRLEQERELLGVLPSLRSSIAPASVTREVDQLSTIRLGSARCSVPTRLAGTRVVADGPRVLITDPPPR